MYTVNLLPPPPPLTSQDVVQSHVSDQQPALQMLISLIIIIQLQNYFGEAIRMNISYAILYEHRVGDRMATKISTGLASRHTQLTRL